MGGYASGKYSLALCDRCGQRYQYLVLRKEWTGFKVCPECYEPKHPQLEPRRRVSDPQALKDARPDQTEPLFVFVGVPLVEDPNLGPVWGVGLVGSVTVRTT